MASPVDTIVKWARSDMPGAPVLTRAAGSMTALLDALLVDGWGLQAATSVVVASGVATATFAADHAAAMHSVVEVAGATGSYTDLNGEQKITVANSNTLKWATALPDGTATGSITVKMAGGGWERPFTGTNLRAYRSASAQRHGQYLRVSDTGVGDTRVTGYESMTAISTGTGPFPTSAQVSGGYYWTKSLTGTDDSVGWLFGTDGRTMYLLVQPLGAGYPVAKIMIFGDMTPEAPMGDAHATLLMGDVYPGDGSGGLTRIAKSNVANDSNATPRAYGGAGACVRGAVGASANLYSYSAFPNPITGGFNLAGVEYRDTAGDAFTRARLPGLRLGLVVGAEAVIPPNSILSAGSAAYAVALSADSVYATATLAPIAIDITGPWR